MTTQTKNKNTQDSIAEIQKIYDLFVVELNKLRSDKNKIVKGIVQRIDEKKVARQLKELQDI